VREPQSFHYVILDFFATENDVTATAIAGDDATAVQWADIASLDAIDLVDGLAAFLASAGVGTGVSGERRV
jgi:hypothetical protein